MQNTASLSIRLGLSIVSVSKRNVQLACWIMDMSSAFSAKFVSLAYIFFKIKIFFVLIQHTHICVTKQVFSVLLHTNAKSIHIYFCLYCIVSPFCLISLTERTICSFCLLQHKKTFYPKYYARLTKLNFLTVQALLQISFK
jgi:hypothetical protein